jgi:hypothetical protein
MDTSMSRGLTRANRRLTWALALALALVPSATCLMGAEMTEADKACCAAMNHDCGEMSVQLDCCAATAPGQAGLASPGSPIPHLVPPALIVVSIITAPEPAAAVPESSVFDTGAPKPSSRPTYLFVSVFRL